MSFRIVVLFLVPFFVFYQNYRLQGEPLDLPIVFEGQDPRSEAVWASLSLSSQKITLSDNLWVVFSILALESIHINTLGLPITVFSDFEVVQKITRPPKFENHQGKLFKRLEFVYELFPLQEGTALISGIKIKFQDQSEKPIGNALWATYSVKFDPMAIDVLRISDSSDDTLGNIQNEILPKRLWYPYLIAILTLCLLYLVVRWVLYRRKVQMNNVVKLLIDYQEEARQALQKLQEKGYIELSQIEDFHVELSYILRRYLERQLGLKAEARTTYEFWSQAISSSKFNPEQRKLLRLYMELSDRVKFAQFNPSTETNIEAFECAKKIIEQTNSA